MLDMLVRLDEIVAQPVLRQMHQELLEEPVLHADETPITLCLENGKGSRKAYAREGGFTLVEVTIILLVLVILSTIMLPQLGNFNRLARRVKVSEDVGGEVDIGHVIDVVLVDSSGADYEGRLDCERLRTMGVQVIDTVLVTDESAPLLDSKLLTDALLSLC